MKRTTARLFPFIALLLLPFALPLQAAAQAGGGLLSITTAFPSQVIELGQSVSLNLTLSASQRQTVSLEMSKLPDGWTSTFRGGGHVIQSAFVDASSSGSVSLELDPPKDLKAGTYDFVVLGKSSLTEATLPITLTVQEKVAGSLSLDTDLPTIKGGPKTTFRYSLTLKNNGDQDLTVNLSADAPNGFQPTFKLSSQEVSSFPLNANESKSISVEMLPITQLEAGSYPFTIYADGGSLRASLDLTAEVTGQSELSVAGPDGRLSGTANAGRDSALKVVVTNNGTAAAQAVELRASAPSDWSVTFDPPNLDQVAAGDKVEVTAHIKPAPKAVAGDYMVTITAQPAEGTQTSADFRITVTTSTLWGAVGVLLIAIAVGVVAMAVTRFGRR